MADDSYSDPELVALYDALNPWGPSDDFYLELAMSAQSVLDVGCGTGVLLRRAREVGHTGRLCGLDPAEAMLEHARRRTDITWVAGYLDEIEGVEPFELVVMTGHAFQVFLDDDEIRTALEGMRAAVADNGRLAFETRNPLVRPWERWTPDEVTEVGGADGAVIRVSHEVELPVTDDVVHLSETFESDVWDAPRVSSGSLRFVDAATLRRHLAAADLEVEQQFGDWTRAPLTDASPEIITVARPVSRP